MAGIKCVLTATTSASSAKNSRRQLTIGTFVKWQREHNKDLQTISWLHCDTDEKGTHVVTLNCCICKRYEEKLVSLKNFRRDWIDGCTNHSKSCLTDHAKSDIHKTAMMHWKTTLAKRAGESHVATTPVGQLLSSIDASVNSRENDKKV